MSVNKAGIAPSEITWLCEQNKKRDAEIAQNEQKISYVLQQQVEGNQILNDLATSRARIEEGIGEIKQGNERLIAELHQLKKQNGMVREQRDTSDKVCKVVTGTVVVGLIASAIILAILMMHS